MAKEREDEVAKAVGCNWTRRKNVIWFYKVVNGIEQAKGYELVEWNNTTGLDAIAQLKAHFGSPKLTNEKE